MVPIAPIVATTLISCEYNEFEYNGLAPGLGYAILHDNSVLAWMVDETGANPPQPVILGSLPPVYAETGDVKSPVWAVRESGAIMIPDMARGSNMEFFNFIATNGESTRSLYANFTDSGLAADFQAWALRNPTLALAEDPHTVAAEEESRKRAEEEKRRAEEESRREPNAA